MTASSNPFRVGVGSQGWGTFVHQNHATGEENGSIMVGMFVSLCLDSKKSSEREFSVSAGTHLGVKLLRFLSHVCMHATNAINAISSAANAINVISHARMQKIPSSLRGYNCL